MKWFGQSWGAPVCDTVPHVETPVGSICVLCDRPIAEGDRGFVIPFSGPPGSPPELAHHKRCFLWSVGVDQNEANELRWEPRHPLDMD